MSVTKKDLDKARRAMERCPCNNDEAIGYISAGPPGRAMTVICGLASHREAATTWAEGVTGLTAEFTPYGPDGRAIR